MTGYEATLHPWRHPLAALAYKLTTPPWNRRGPRWYRWALTEWFTFWDGLW